jgi:hypothetical protein
VSDASNAIPRHIECSAGDALTSRVSPSFKVNSLPQWLTPTIGYLYGVAEDAAWQDLVTEFVEFEKCGPPNGVSFIHLFLSSLEIDYLNRSLLRS